MHNTGVASKTCSGHGFPELKRPGFTRGLLLATVKLSEAGLMLCACVPARCSSLGSKRDRS